MFSSAVGVGDADMHGRKLIHDRQNLVHTKQPQFHFRGAGGEVSILCCTTGGGWWETIASSAGVLGPISAVKDGQNFVHAEQSQLQLRAAGGGAPISLYHSAVSFITMGGGWWSTVAITSSAGKFGPTSTVAHNVQGVVHTKQSQLHLSGAGGGAASILCCGGLPIATGGGWLGAITSSAGKSGPLVSTVVNGCATTVDCANAYLDGVQFRAAIGSVLVEGERPSTLISCNWETNPVEVVIVLK